MNEADTINGYVVDQFTIRNTWRSCRRGVPDCASESFDSSGIQPTVGSSRFLQLNLHLNF